MKMKKARKKKVIEKKVVITTGALLKLSGTIVAPELGDDDSLAPAILFIHGWRGKEDRYIERAREFVARGFVCLTVNLRGHGSSEGGLDTATRNNHLMDVGSAHAFLAEYPGVDASRIGIFASSYGCYLAMLFTGHRNVAWLVLRAPALYRNAGFATRTTAQAIKELGDYRRRRVTPGRNFALKALRDFTGDVLIIAGECDGDVPKQTIENVAGACKAAASVTVETIAGADHVLSDPEWRAEANSVADRWIAQVTHKKAG